MPSGRPGLCGSVITAPGSSVAEESGVDNVATNDTVGMTAPMASPSAPVYGTSVVLSVVWHGVRVKCI